MPLVVLVLVLAIVAWLWWDWSNTLFVLKVSNGRLEVARGTPPGDFVRAARDIVRRPVVSHGTIKGVKAEHGVSIRARGLDEGQVQRLRNTLRLSPQSQLRSGQSPVNERNFWRAIGLAWLLELIFRR